MAKKSLPGNWFDTITKSTNNVKDKKANILLWGPAGTGKTYFSKSCPKPYIIAAEDGVLTLHDEDIPHLPLYTGEYKIYDSCVKAAQAIAKKDDIDTVVLDSEAKLSELLTEEIMEEEGISRMRTQDWGTLNARISTINNLFLQMDKHFVATCGEAIKTSREDEEEKEATFNLRGGYRDQMPYEFDFLLYTERKKLGKTLKYYFHTVEQKGRRAKTRVPLPEKIENPTFDVIWEAIQSSIKQG